MNRPHICIRLLPLGFPSHSGPHSALSGAPCAIRHVLVNYFIHSINGVYVSILLKYSWFTRFCWFLWRRQWQPTPVLLPGKSHGRRSSPWGRWVGHDQATSLSLFTFMHWRRKWQSTPVFLPGESQGRGSLVGCRLWDRAELDMTEAT